MKAHSFLILVSAAGVGLVSAMPSGEAPKPAAALESGGNPSKPNPWMKDEVLAASVSIHPVELSRAADGHFYADVAVDGVESRMLVDTGASVIALTGADAEAMGIRWDPNDVQPIGKGASGTVYGVPVMLGRVELGRFDMSNVDAVVVPEGLDISLLGQTFLSRVPSVAISDGTLTLSD
jgi:aspartyl protease family protein